MAREQHEEHPESVRSEPVPVPPPAGDTPTTEFHEPAAQPTAFGAGTVGGAAAAAAMAAPGPRATEHDVAEEDADRRADGAVGPDADRDRPGSDEVTVAAPYVDTDTVPAPAGPAASTLVPADAARDFRDRWREVQLRFVDDPRAATGQAQALVEESLEAVARALAARKDELGDWQDADDDTERLRTVVRRYRDLLDRVLDL
jgi:hypothetical protein